MSALLNDDIIIMGGFDAEGNVVGSIEKLNESEIVDVFDSESNILLSEFKLYQNYPNPFNPVTTINYTVPYLEDKNENSNLTLKVYDILGNEVRTLIDERLSPGNYSIDFDASDFPSGVYYYQLKTKNYLETKKMILLK